MTKLSNDFKMIEAIMENKFIQYLAFEDFDEKYTYLLKNHKDKKEIFVTYGYYYS